MESSAIAEKWDKKVHFYNFKCETLIQWYEKARKERHHSLAVTGWHRMAAPPAATASRGRSEMTDAAPTDEEAIAVYKVLMKATVKKGFNVKSKQASICSCRLRAPSRWPAWAAGDSDCQCHEMALCLQRIPALAHRPGA